MRSASCYTNKVKVTAFAKNTKVEYPGHVAKNRELLQATLPCNPNFAIQSYQAGVPCNFNPTCWNLLSNRK